MKTKLRSLFKFFLTLIAFFQISLLLVYFISFIIGPPKIRNYYIELYDQDGNLYYESNNQQTGSWVSLDEVSPYFIKSILAIEDANFYYHQGLDYSAIIRATLLNIKNQNLNNGASTISQQYVKTLFLTNERSFTTKLKEAFITFQLETHYSKEDILEGYINTIYFGHGIYGIENAAYFYFSKDAKDLTLSEASLLAGVINGPSLYSPLNDEVKAKERQNVVIEALYNKHYIDEITYQKEINTPITLNTSEKIEESQTLYYYKDAVLNELNNLKINENDFEKGLKIYTNLNMNYQNSITEAINKEIINTPLQSSVIIVEPYTSKVLALSGGNDYIMNQYNRALYSKRQIASTIKGLLYYEALANGFKPTTKLLSEETTFRVSETTTYSPTNNADIYANKEITLVNAISVSDNIYAVKTLLLLGEETFTKRLDSFGFKDVSADTSLALGSFEASIYDVALIYTTFASEGVYNKPYFIERIEDDSGNILYKYEAKDTQLLDQDTCLILNQLLTSPFDANNIDYAYPTMLQYRSNITFAAKSGTSEYDSLVVAYNPEILIGVWVGYDNNQVLEDEYKKIAKNMFYSISLDVSNVYTSSWYEPTDNLSITTINPVTGAYDPNGSVYWFKKK